MCAEMTVLLWIGAIYTQQNRNRVDGYRRAGRWAASPPSRTRRPADSWSAPRWTPCSYWWSAGQKHSVSGWPGPPQPHEPNPEPPRDLAVSVRVPGLLPQPVDGVEVLVGPHVRERLVQEVHERPGPVHVLRGSRSDDTCPRTDTIIVSNLLRLCAVAITTGLTVRRRHVVLSSGGPAPLSPGRTAGHHGRNVQKQNPTDGSAASQTAALAPAALTIPPKSRVTSHQTSSSRQINNKKRKLFIFITF